MKKSITIPHNLKYMLYSMGIVLAAECRADLYKCTNAATGKILYQDRPCTVGEKASSVRIVENAIDSSGSTYKKNYKNNNNFDSTNDATQQNGGNEDPKRSEKDWTYGGKGTISKQDPTSSCELAKKYAQSSFSTDEDLYRKNLALCRAENGVAEPQKKNLVKSCHRNGNIINCTDGTTTYVY